MKNFMTQSNPTWAEDRALQRCNLSADPGAKTEGGIERGCSIPSLHPFPSPFGIGPIAKNLRGRKPRNPRQDVFFPSLTPTRHNSIFR